MRYRIEDKYGANPAMLTIYTDDDPNFHPKEYFVETWGGANWTVFNTYKVMENHPSTYVDPDDIVSLIMETVYYSTQMRKKTDEKIMDLFIPIVRKLMSKGYSKEHINLVLAFIKIHVKFGDSENYRIFEEKLIDMEKYEEVEDITTFFSFDRAEARAQQAEAEKELERQEKERERLAKERSVLLMINQGISIELISKVLEVTVKDIEAIQEKYKDNNPISELLKTRSDN